MRLRIRRCAKTERLDIDHDATFFAVVRAILDLEMTPRPRGYDKVASVGCRAEDRSGARATR